MGRFVNSDNRAFQAALNSKIYVDKTGLLEYTNSVLNSTNAYICNSRPRRFGKSITTRLEISVKCFPIWKLATDRILGHI